MLICEAFTLIVALYFLVTVAPYLHGSAVREVNPDGVLRGLAQLELLSEVLSALPGTRLDCIHVPPGPENP